MFASACYWITASVMALGVSAMSQLSVMVKTEDHDRASTWQTDTVDDEWASKVLEDPTDDRGWIQPCQDDWNDDRQPYCEVREFPYSPGALPIAIHGGQNGGMTVMGWDREQVRIVYRVKARARTLERSKELAKQIGLRASKGWVRPTGPVPGRGEWWSVEIKAWVPQASDLALRTHNGPVGVRNVRGTMEIESVNGPMSLVDLAGAVYARAQNGPLHVQLAGSTWEGAGMDAEAQNGPLNLVVPKNYSALLQTGTYNGSVVIDYALEFQGRVRGHFTTTLGSGGAPVRVVTGNGPFRITQR